MVRPLLILATATACAALTAAPAMSQGPDADPAARVNALMGARRYREAESLLRKMVEQRPTPELKYALAYSLTSQFRYRDAEPLLQQASDARPKNDSWLHLWAACKLELGQGTVAAELLDRALAVNPAPEYRYARAMCALNLGDNGRAEAELRLCVKALPKDAEAWAALAQLLVDRGDYEPALEPSRACLKADPRHVGGRYLLGLALSRTGAEAESVQAFETVLKDHPGHLGASYNVARALLRSGRAEEGRARMEAFKTLSVVESRLQMLAADVKRNPSALEARLALAEALLASGPAAKALPHLKLACELDPSRAATYRLLARALKGDGRYEDAARATALAEQLENGKR